MADLPPKGSSLAAYQQYVTQMCQERGFDKHSVEQKFVKLLEELGELAQAATKTAGLSHSKDRTHKTAGEAADVFLIFLDLCRKLDIDLEQAIHDKEEQNKKRTWK